MSKNEDLPQKVLAFVAAHPGAKLVEIEKAAGVSRIEAGKSVRALMDEGRVCRDEDTRQYFPVEHAHRI